MTTGPRLLVIMGSGETSPTMSKVHRELFDRLRPSGAAVPAVLLDTPFGFQENADDIAQKAVEYFSESVRRPVAVASFRRGDEVSTLAAQTALARIREAQWVFSGPGSPSYALRQWRGSPVPGLLADKLRHGGCITFASAAAATLGRLAVPVYEIYKVGQDPHWVEGLDLLGVLGLPAIVIPHYNNAEGGHHDTRYCYLGERRLAPMEADLDPGEFILGFDEHTAGVIDLDARQLTVRGLGYLTVRRGGRSAPIEAGQTVALDALGGLVEESGRSVVGMPPTPAGAEGAGSGGATGDDPSGDGGLSPLLDEVAVLDERFAAALAARDPAAAAGCVLELDQVLLEWSRDTLESDELDRGRATLRTMIVRLGEAADAGLRDPRSVVGPFIDALLTARARARDAGRFDDADWFRDWLVGAGVEVRDSRDGTEWQLG